MDHNIEQILAGVKNGQTQVIESYDACFDDACLDDTSLLLWKCDSENPEVNRFLRNGKMCSRHAVSTDFGCDILKPVQTVMFEMKVIQAVKV